MDARPSDVKRGMVAQAALRLAENAVRDISGKWNAKPLTLVGLNHQNYPENESKKMQEMEKNKPARQARPTGQAMGHDAYSKKHPQDHVDDV
jgi:hypothetical protein